ncbi:hypothetical protein [Amycolatopsis taiwanensis]|uniref:hypothetical protein n=1 Tax=Amycolatopsis taiwanensis TaxID=342230 RepID=UPI0004B0DAD5|nr:hypothetical protein [Amycolatopsis taiwanensis]
MDFKHELQVIEGRLIDKVEAKVKAASTAAAVTGLVLSLLGAYVFRGAVPEWVQALIDTVVTGGLAFVAGWLAKHTPRTIAPPPAPVTPAPPPTPPASA